MGRVISLVSFQVKDCHRDLFLEAARTTLKPFWEAHGSGRYEVYAEIGPTGPTGRVVEVNHFETREAYLRMSEFARTAADVPADAYRWLTDPRFQVLEVRIGPGQGP